MQVSSCNQFVGTVVAIREGAVNGVVTVDTGSELIKAGITMEAIRELGLREGVQATAVAKLNSVMFAPGTTPLPITARNQFAGTVSRVERGAVNGIVTLVTPDGTSVAGMITLDAIDELNLRENTPAIAIVESTDILVGA